MAYDFRQISALEAKQLISVSGDPLLALESDVPRTNATDVAQLASEVRQFLAGDHWQDGDGWVGPKPSNSTDGASDAKALALVEEKFVSRNMIADVCGRRADGIVGHEPPWGYSVARPLKDDEEATAAEEAMIDEAESAVKVWWNKRRAHLLWQLAEIETLLNSRAVLRLFIPTSRLKPIASDPEGAQGESPDTPAEESADTGSEAAVAQPALGVVAPTIADALDHIYVEIIPAEDGAVFTDADSMERCGVARYRRQGLTPMAAGAESVELSFLDGDSDVAEAERATVIRVLLANEAGGQGQEVTFALGGRLTHFAITHPALITPQIVSLQKALNLTLSMVPRNVETSGFLERIIMNAQLPGEWEIDPVTKLPTDRFILGHYVTGPGTTQWLQGAPTVDAQGNAGQLTPTVQFREPSPVDPTLKAAAGLVMEILREAKQAHILGTDQVQSGISRVQARADFEKSLGQSKAAIEPAGRWLLDTVLAWAIELADDKGGLADASAQLSAYFTCVVDTGPLDRTEVQAVTEAAKDGFVSIDYAQEALGVEDIDAENARINAEPGKRGAIRLLKAQALKAFVDAGLTLEAAADLAGFEDDEIKLIAKDVADNPVPAPVPGSLVPAKNPDGSPKVDGQGNPVMEPAKPAAVAGGAGGAPPGGAGAAGGSGGAPPAKPSAAA